LSDNPLFNRLSVKVTPNARQNEVTAFTEGVLSVKIAAPPVQGKANRELIIFLSRLLGVSKSSVSIVKGETSRNKVIAVDGMDIEDIIKKLPI
jgi:uncharacterized protein (TIGR00251 family)